MRSTDVMHISTSRFLRLALHELIVFFALTSPLDDGISELSRHLGCRGEGGGENPADVELRLTTATNTRRVLMSVTE